MQRHNQTSSSKTVFRFFSCKPCSKIVAQRRHTVTSKTQVSLFAAANIQIFVVTNTGGSFVPTELWCCSFSCSCKSNVLAAKNAFTAINLFADTGKRALISAATNLCSCSSQIVALTVNNDKCTAWSFKKLPSE